MPGGAPAAPAGGGGGYVSPYNNPTAQYPGGIGNYPYTGLTMFNGSTPGAPVVPSYPGPGYTFDYGSNQWVRSTGIPSPGAISAPGGNYYPADLTAFASPYPGGAPNALPPGVTLANAAAAASGSSGGWYGGTYYPDPYTATGGTTTPAPTGGNNLPAGYSLGPNGTVIGPDGSVIPAAHG